MLSHHSLRSGRRRAALSGRCHPALPRPCSPGTRLFVVVSLLVLSVGIGPQAVAAVGRTDTAPHAPALPSPGGAADPIGVWPLSPTPDVLGSFDPPDGEWGAGHRGVDLAGRAGQVVRSALAGSVSFVGMIAGKSVVVVDHGTTRTTYEPVVTARRVGDPVAAGGAIGSLAPAPSHCAPRACLHWGWIRNADDVYLDPLALVGAGPVRLLPLWRSLPATPGLVLRPPSSSRP